MVGDTTHVPQKGESDFSSTCRTPVMVEMEFVIVRAFDDAARDALILAAILGSMCSHAGIAY